MMPRVPHGVVFEHELRRHRRAVRQRERRCGVELRIGEGAHGLCRLATLLAQVRQRLILRHTNVIAGVVGVHRRDGVPGDVGHRLAAGNQAREIQLDGIDVPDVVDDDADRPTVAHA